MLPLLLVLACSSQPEPAAAPAPAPTPPAEDGVVREPEAPTPGSEPMPPAPNVAAGLDKVGAAAQEFGGALKAELQAAVKAGGPPQGIEVCNEAAPRIAAEVGEKHGVKIGRSSLKLRNPDNAGPPWVTAWLEEQGADAKVEGLKPVRTVADTAVDGEVARLIVPIGVDPVCVACHGPAEGLAAEVKERLATHYPEDQATGYAVGDLRGALWAEVPVEEGEGEGEGEGDGEGEGAEGGSAG